MARSAWKPPFVDGFLLKKVEAALASNNTRPIETMSRRSTILPSFVGLTIAVYNGKQYLPVQIKEEMVGTKLGVYSATRTFRGHSGDKKVKRG